MEEGLRGIFCVDKNYVFITIGIHSNISIWKKNNNVQLKKIVVIV